VQSVDKEIRKDSCHLWEIKKHPSQGMSTHPRLRIPLPYVSADVSPIDIMLLIDS